MNLLYDPPPNTVALPDGIDYEIYTDFRDWIRFFDMQEDPALSQRDKLMLMLEWYRDKPPLGQLEAALEALVRFAARKEAPPSDAPDPAGASTERSTDRVLSWRYDAAYVYAAFLSVYHIDLIQTQHMHWHIFLALFDALPDDTPIKQRMGYRSVNLAAVKDQKERRRIAKIQERIRIPTEALDAYQCGEFFG